ncbi:MAG: hypothetical protein JWN72_2264, partial [Thermoleophilia bacterium]|nr:hypothetical protein [Thermoleophilia bacterium]
MRHRPLRTVATSFAVVLCALGVAPTLAAADAKLQISPTKLDLGGAAGSSQVVPVSVTSAGDTPLTVTFRHVDFGLRDDYSIVTYEDSAPETTSFSTRRWFSVPKPSYTVGVGQTVQVPVTVTIPKNTPGGTYLGIPMFVGKPPSDGA